MQTFYYIILGGSGIYLLVQLTAYIFYGKVFFANAGILFEQRKNKFEWQMVFPKNLVLLVVFLFSTSLFGLMMDALGVVGWLSLPLAAVGGLAVNFIINIAVSPLLCRLSNSGSPTDAQLEGAEGTALEEITEDSYGKIEVRNGGRCYYFDALTANGNPISAGEKVIVIYAQEGLCFVESEARFCDVLFTEDMTYAEVLDDRTEQ
ncbi:MAG: NfeD family protein [Oscillospiraceae bacterium]|nr:NfeD family protein [Oscillospiraceae bacterium]